MPGCVVQEVFQAQIKEVAGDDNGEEKKVSKETTVEDYSLGDAWPYHDCCNHERSDVRATVCMG
jgi:hypothetical protein